LHRHTYPYTDPWHANTPSKHRTIYARHCCTDKTGEQPYWSAVPKSLSDQRASNLTFSWRPAYIDPRNTKANFHNEPFNFSNSSGRYYVDSFKNSASYVGSYLDYCTPVIRHASNPTTLYDASSDPGGLCNRDSNATHYRDKPTTYTTLSISIN